MDEGPAGAYRRAESLLPRNFRNLIFSDTVQPVWLSGTDDFCYTVREAAGDAVYRVDSRTRQRTGVLLPGQLPRPEGTAPGAPPRIGDVVCDGATIAFTVGGRRFRWNPATAALQDRPAPEVRRPGELLSPDRTLAAYVDDHNLWVRDTRTDTGRQVTFDGTAEVPYAIGPDASTPNALAQRHALPLPPVLLWLPDSRRVVTHRLHQDGMRDAYLSQSSPPDGSGPRRHHYRYAHPGDAVVARAELLVVDMATGATTPVSRAPIDCPWATPLQTGSLWRQPGRDSVYHVDQSRSGDRATLLAIDPDTGAVTTLFEETSEDYVQTHPEFCHRPNVHVLANGDVLWWSERSGWGQLYLVRDGRVERAVTAGAWLVRDLVGVDETRQHVYFTGAGRENGLDPYARQFYRVHLATGVVDRLTHDTLDHDVIAAPSGRFFIDVRSDWKTPPATRLLDENGRDTLDLATADVTALRAAGWSPPERFSVMAADGETKLYGLLYLPGEGAEKLPVLDDIYPGPQHLAAPYRFPSATARWPSAHAASMAALGFAVMVVDARGTPLRSRAMQRAGRGLAAAEPHLSDHVAALRQLAGRYPRLDLGNVGIHGVSGGGYAAARAILEYPDTYHAAVSIAGNHDERYYNALWGERFVGSPGTVDYFARSNAALASRLQGRLLLVHGEMDDNVYPDLTMRFVKALIDAGKDFDFLLLPNTDHSLLETEDYWVRRRWDYFVRNLRKESPPGHVMSSKRPLRDAAMEVLYGESR
ncbi:S9 family peptidase [Amycolatopsis jejuensis]|uniref:S9 family peptidase n=1 Tax=Amycolatopsis jejuensis TaxID=330084 RepID=UPI000690EC1A|nr:DPP IV N-terminal domain-containing protein [Amycolatopsis jejuensis]